MSLPAGYKCNQWGWFWKESDNSGPYYLAADGVMRQFNLSNGDIVTDAWGVQKVSIPYSLLHSLFTFDIPKTQWFTYENNVQVYTSTYITSVNGAATLATSATKTTLRLESRLCPPYEPNRGQLYSTAGWMPSKTADGIREWGVGITEAAVFFRLKANGLVYAVLRSLGVETKEELIDTAAVNNFDIEKNNTYDIQYQWRGAGNYNFFINQKLVHSFTLLGTASALTMSNPALPAFMQATRVTQDVVCSFGCVDITSENGKIPHEERNVGYAAAAATVGADKPVLVLYNPLTINGKTNTRTVNLHSITIDQTKKGRLTMWRTRNPANIIGATLVAGYNGAGTYVQTDSPDMNLTAVRATAAAIANMELLWATSLQELGRTYESFEESNTDVTMVRGDYIVFTYSATGSADIIVAWGEEI